MLPFNKLVYLFNPLVLQILFWHTVISQLVFWIRLFLFNHTVIPAMSYRHTECAQIFLFCYGTSLGCDNFWDVTRMRGGCGHFQHVTLRLSWDVTRTRRNVDSLCFARWAESALSQPSSDLNSEYFSVLQQPLIRKLWILLYRNEVQPGTNGLKIGTILRITLMSCP